MGPLYFQARVVRRILASPVALPYVGLTLLALSFRLFGSDWGNFHPDEWAIASVARNLSWPDSLSQFFSAQSPLNPQWFNYGSLPIYIFRILSVIGDALRGVLPSFPSDIVIWRATSGFADAVTVLIVARIGNVLYGHRVGLLAGLLYAVAVLPIQLSHFYTVDPLLTTFLTGSLLASLHFVRSGKLRWGVTASVLLGLAMATKASGAVFLWPVALAWIAWSVSKGGYRLERTGWLLSGTLLGGGIAAAVFIAGQPYSLIDWRGFWQDVGLQSQLVRGVVEFPYTVQYDQTAPIMYHLRNMVVWGLGLPLGLAALAGALLLMARVLGRRQPGELLLLASLLIPFIFFGVQQVKFMRYLLPLYPILVVVAALFLTQAGRVLGRWSLGERWAPAALFAVVLLPTFFYAYAFTNVYAETHPTQRMASWIQSNVPRGATIATESWDQAFAGAERYTTLQVSPYDPDTEAKVQHLAETLVEADYAFLFSNRAYGALSRLPERFPLMGVYYQQLLSGELGYQVVRVESAYPSAFGLSLVNDTFGPVGLDMPESLVAPVDDSTPLLLGAADESFTVYDHPKVILLQKTQTLTTDELSARLRPALPLPPEQLPPSQLLMDEELARAQREGGTWGEIFDLSGFLGRYPLIVWLLAFQVIALLGLPFTMRVFRALPDRGYLLGKVLSLLIVAYVTWLLASLRLVSFSRGSVLIGLAVLGTLSALVVYTNRREVIRTLKTHWRVFVTAEVLFLVAFFAFALLRAANPDLWHPFRGGEKPMDLAYLTAVTRSTFMPPYDPWFAGGYLNYYYFGQFIVATLIHLTGIAPEIAFNLAIPLLWALTFGAAYSIVYNLAQAFISVKGTREIAPLKYGPVLAGLAGGFFVALVGNLDGVIQIVQRVRDEAQSGFGAVGTVLSGQGFDYWRSSRMIDVPGSISITEFPFFTFLFGDLHAHLIAMPLTLLVVGLALSAALAIDLRRGVLSRFLPLFVLTLPLGALLATNAWDYPTYLIVVPVTVVLAHLARGDHLKAAVVWGGVIFAAVFALSFLAFAPYHRDNVIFYTEIVTSPEQTPLRSYLAIFGLPLFIVVVTLGKTLWRLSEAQRDDLRTLMKAVGAVATMKSPEGRRVWAILAIALGVGIIALPFAMRGYGVLAVNLILLTGLSTVLLASDVRLPQKLAFAAAALALVLIAGVDLFAIQDYLVRMNTIFRLYLQAWVLLGLSAGFLLWWLVHEGALKNLTRSVGKIAFVSALMTLVVSASTYPVLGTRARLADRFDLAIPLTLNGMAFMETSNYRDVNDIEIELRWEQESLEWLRANVEGTPVVAEAVLPPAPYDITYFRLLSRVAVYTGLPVVIGWPWHQTQQRGIGVADPEINKRQADVRALFDSGDPERIRSVLRMYNVEYVYVGQLETAYYSAEGIGMLAGMPDLSLVYENPRAAIYRVIQTGS